MLNEPFRTIEQTETNNKVDFMIVAGDRDFSGSKNQYFQIYRN